MKITRLSALGLMAAAFLSNACSYQPEDAGQCKLVCGSAIIGASDPKMSIKVKSLAIDTECSTESAGKTVGPYRAAFLIGEEIEDETGAAAGVRPVPNISIEPFLIGNRPTLENENDGDARTKGLLTLKNNWCSDACGIVTLDAASVCPAPETSNNLSIQIHSGALFSEAAVFPIKTRSPVLNAP